MSSGPSIEQRRARAATLSKAAWLLVGIALALGLARSVGADAPLTESRVKAFFLLNFAKYVEWPTNHVSEPGECFILCVAGDAPFVEELRQAAAGKSVGGLPILVRRLQSEKDLANCRILYLMASERKRVPELLSQVKAVPVLTVGETEQFTELGGIINFVKKEGKVRLEINLAPARDAGLRLSSRLLDVADVVKGRS